MKQPFLMSCSEKEEVLELSKQDFFSLQLMRMNLLDHYTFFNKGVYHLVIHGNNILQKVYWKDKFLVFSELPSLIREENNIPQEEDVVVKVYTCYGGLMPYYVDTHTLIISAFDNLNELSYKTVVENNKMFCYFSKIAA